MNLNINDFNLPDLLDFLEIFDKNITLDQINSKINEFIKNINDDKLINFLQQAKIKINQEISKLMPNQFNLNTIEKFENYNNHKSINQYNNQNLKNQLYKNNHKKENNSLYKKENKNSDENSDENLDENSDKNSENYQDNDEDNNKTSESKKKQEDLLKLKDSTFSKIKNKEIFLNMNTNNRLIYNVITESSMNNLDTGNSFFILPTTFNNIISIELIDILIDYNCLEIVGESRNNNKFLIGKYYNNGEHLENAVNLKLENFTINELISNINKEINHTLNFELSNNNYLNLNNNFVTFNFEKYFQSAIDISFILIEFPKTNNNYNLANVLGFSNLVYNRKLYFSSNNNSVKAISPIDLNLNHIYFCLDEYVQNSIQSNNLLLGDNQFSSLKVLAKLNFESNLITNTNLSDLSNTSPIGSFKILNANIIKKLNNTRNFNGPINIQKLQINIIDDFGNKIFLNYKNFHFTLKLIESLKFIKNFENIIYS